MKLKRPERIALITRLFLENPNCNIPLEDICNMFNISRTTASEDVSAVNSAFTTGGYGFFKKKSGPGGGLTYMPSLPIERCREIQENLCQKLNDSSRVLGGGFIYTSDIMFDPSTVNSLASIFAAKYAELDIDYVVTIETKGIPLAVMTAKYLNVPAVVVRREQKISEGPTISINYFSSTSEKMKKMSISKKSITPGSKALIIDDFMRAGGSIKGVCELLTEFNIEISGVGVAIAYKEPKLKKISEYDPIIYMDISQETKKEITLYPNKLFFE